jgi:hypothetical protein
MNGSKNNISNRNGTQKRHCSTCGSEIKSLRVVQSGKARMVKMCNCK